MKIKPRHFIIAITGILFICYSSYYYFGLSELKPAEEQRVTTEDFEYVMRLYFSNGRKVESGGHEVVKFRDFLSSDNRVANLDVSNYLLSNNFRIKNDSSQQTLYIYHDGYNRTDDGMTVVFDTKKTNFFNYLLESNDVILFQYNYRFEDSMTKEERQDLDNTIDEIYNKKYK